MRYSGDGPGRGSCFYLVLEKVRDGKDKRDFGPGKAFFKRS